MWLIGLIMWNSSIASSPQAQPRERHHRPQGRVRVLPAVFAHPRKVTLDVAGIVRHAVERRRQQQHQLRVAAHQVGAHGLHRPLGAPRLRRLRRAPPTTASANRSGTRRSAPSRAASRRRSRRGGTSRRPTASSSMPVSHRASSRYRCARSPRSRPSHSGANSFSTTTRNQPSQTLSPRPSWPTRFMPSFQSPEPISGRPWAP